MIRIAVNGFGRIGRTFLRVVMRDARAHVKISLVAVNIGPGVIDESIVTMFAYDTIMGTYPGTVAFRAPNVLIIDGHEILLFAEKDPVHLPWKKLSIDWVVEASGKFVTRDGATLHQQAGASAVLITAPAQGEDCALIQGVNDALFRRKEDKIVSIGSCTTNAFFPILKILDDAFDLVAGTMTTVHAYTNSQVLLDVPAKNIRLSRSAGLNIIPSTTGAASMLGKVLPHLQSVIIASSIRVPVAKVSLIDFTFMVRKSLSVVGINELFSQVAIGEYSHIVGFSCQELVSSDYGGDPHSVVIDGPLTAVVHESIGKVFGWYDNEWGFSERLKDFFMRFV